MNHYMLAIACIFLMAPHTEQTDLNQDRMIRMCGKRLLNTLKWLCAATACDHTADKRGRAPIWNHLVNKKGIAEDCCSNGCSLAYLKKYCCW